MAPGENKTMLVQNFGVQKKNIMVFLEVANGICESREYYIYIDSVWISISIFAAVKCGDSD